MKILIKNSLLLLSVAVLTLLTGCKTTEANYRAAYEKAKSKGESEAVDREVYDQIERESGPAIMTFGDVEFPCRPDYLAVQPLKDLPGGTVRNFSLTTGQFKQTFNAQSMAKRLKELGFADAFVCKNREGFYVVIAGSYAEAAEVAEAYNRVKGMQVGAVGHFPYVIVKPGIDRQATSVRRPH